MRRLVGQTDRELEFLWWKVSSEDSESCRELSHVLGDVNLNGKGVFRVDYLEWQNLRYDTWAAELHLEWLISGWRTMPGYIHTPAGESGFADGGVLTLGDAAVNEHGAPFLGKDFGQAVAGRGLGVHRGNCTEQIAHVRPSGTLLYSLTDVLELFCRLVGIDVKDFPRATLLGDATGEALAPVGIVAAVVATFGAVGRHTISVSTPARRSRLSGGAAQ